MEENRSESQTKDRPTEREFEKEAAADRQRFRLAESKRFRLRLAESKRFRLKHLRTDTFADFEDLKITVGNGTAIGKTLLDWETIQMQEFMEKLSHGLDSIGKIATEIRGMYNLMEKRKKAISEKEKKNNIWNAIKETPNLYNHGRYKALALIQKMGVKDAFLKMLPEERSEWISFNME
ncbi:uncharacterized protein At2g29880-like [Ziziphus jujuba]|uniref:Uncharacterized protein At2g29880-like n=1 Tax=Ziziphus jujuba TaxID=326968 RepID=A0ABM3ZUF9_ZIZJJ|nr:uncharacterized protein At2g29880-like [Ziziphus jujuba]